MGLTGGSSNITFVSFIDGKFCVKTHEGDPDAVRRTNKNNKVVYERYYTQIDGRITKIQLVDKGEFGDFICIDLKDDDDEQYQVQIPWGQFGLRDSFIKRLPNINENEAVSIVCFKDKESGRTSLGVKQNEEWVKQNYTKDNPGDLPQPTEKMVKGKKEWDFSEVENFLYEVLKDEAVRFEAPTY